MRFRKKYDIVFPCAETAHRSASDFLSDSAGTGIRPRICAALQRKECFYIKKLLTTRSLCLSAIIAALYAALTLLLAPISYGNIQCRVSEAFTVLPMVLPQSIPGLFVGCLIANIFSPTPSIWDIVFGSLTTLIAACGTYALRKKPVLAAACPIVANGVIVGLMLALLYGLPVALTMGEVAIGELGAVFLGMLLLTVLKSRVDFNKISKM